MSKCSPLVAILLLAGITTPLHGQQWHPPSNPEVTTAELEQLRTFIARFDPASFHYPAEIPRSGQMQVIRQPRLDSCTTDPDIDQFARFRNAQALSEHERRTLEAALQSSVRCSGPFGGVSNPFGRVPQGNPLTSLRSLLGRRAQIVDYRLATTEQRAACTRTIARPLPRFGADYTFIRAYTMTTHIAYDVSSDGTAHNVRELAPPPGTDRNYIGDVGASAYDAARDSRFEPPMHNGAPLHCINVIERFAKVGDGNGAFQAFRDFDPIFGRFER